VFFIHGPDAVPDIKLVTLQEALENGWAVINETGNVNNLTVENKSPEYEVFIQEGDIIRGGKQDRLIARDMLLPPNSGTVPFPCHCVEQGRWTGRGNEAATRFQSSDQYVVNPNLKYANATGQQDIVWANVSNDQQRLSKATQAKVTENASSTSLQLTLEHPAVKAKVADYEDALRTRGEGQADVIGVVFVVNGQVMGADLYGSNALFRKVWPKLLRAAATEALAGQTEGSLAYTPSVPELERFLAQGPRRRTTVDADAALNGYADTIPEPTGLMNGRLNPDRIDRQTVDAVVTQDQLGRPNLPDAAAATLRTPARSLRAVSGNRENPVVGTITAGVENLGFNAAPRAANPSFASPAIPQQQASSQPGGFVAPTNRATNGGQFGSEFTNTDANPQRADERRAPATTLRQSNNLSISRVESGMGLVTESRDQTRQNALIHKSLINPNAK
jgi:hypothetical protein